MSVKRNLIAGALLLAATCAYSADTGRPNIIIMMADDLGYGDTGFNGNSKIETPHLDTMAEAGALLTNFHAGGPVCSPTRGTCLTGRHYQRYGIYSANKAHLPTQEITISEILKEKGYTTGHFGKWHLGTLSKTISPKGKSRQPEVNYSPPSEHGYDRSFVTESAVQTWNPSKGRQAVNNPFYDDGVAVDPNDESLEGGASRVVMDRAIPFIRKAVAEEQPFFSVIWFHAPHEDVLAGPEYRELYKEYPEAEQHYYGCITELDEQVGRLRSELKTLGVADNTMIWFSSDNGPENIKPEKSNASGVTGGLRARKRSLYEGGIRVPALVEWPGHIQADTVSDAPMSTLDYLPTIQTLIGYTMPDKRPIDGENILDLITGKQTQRKKSIPFFHLGRVTLIEGDYKYYTTVGSNKHELYRLSNDRAEKINLAAEYPERVGRMSKQILAFVESTKKSYTGADYNDPTFKPAGPWVIERKGKKR